MLLSFPAVFWCNVEDDGDVCMRCKADAEDEDGKLAAFDDAFRDAAAAAAADDVTQFCCSDD